jgi:hypothetical protein
LPPPPSGSMKPLVGLNHFTIPLGTALSVMDQDGPKVNSLAGNGAIDKPAFGP